MLGNVADRLFVTDLGFKGTYVLIGIALGVVMLLSSFVIKAPSEDTVLPERKKKANAKSEDFEVIDLKPSEMIRRFTFWRALLALICIAAVGNSVISFARDLVLSVEDDGALATTLVGVLSICNGLGRIITGAVFDAKGRRFTMIAASALTVIAAATTLVAVNVSSLVLLIIGLCLTGISYGTSPTISSAFTSAFYGTKHFAANLSISNFNLMAASFIATACSGLLTSSGGYITPFVLLLSLSGIALVLNFSIKRP
jgi:OFA family oxalate/formate antiporter-like MFS transporter